jgi:hypothetical protein
LAYNLVSIHFDLYIRLQRHHITVNGLKSNNLGPFSAPIGQRDGRGTFSGGRERGVDPGSIRGATDKDSESKRSEMSPTFNGISTLVEESENDSLVEPNRLEERSATTKNGQALLKSRIRELVKNSHSYIIERSEVTAKFKVETLLKAVCYHFHFHPHSAASSGSNGVRASQRLFLSDIFLSECTTSTYTQHSTIQNAWA